MSERVLALVPARSGSRRLADKNIRPLAGHPLLAYTIASSLESGVFTDVVASTDSERYAGIARHYGAEVPFLRPAGFAGELSPDIEWVTHALLWLAERGRTYDAFAILRPTSPFRTEAAIRRAWEALRSNTSADSIRAVQKCREHPAKMWTMEGNAMKPFWEGKTNGAPWHSSPYQSLPALYVQNASLEIARARAVSETRSIAGNTVMPFFTEGLEGFDINSAEDLRLAEELVRTGEAALPYVGKAAFCA